MGNLDLDGAINKLFEQETSEDMLELKKLILKRIATETDVKQARIPAPLNITEVGGYYNLIMNDEKMRRQMLALALGLPYISEE